MEVYYSNGFFEKWDEESGLWLREG